MSILIVDDSPAHCHLIGRILHRAGYSDTIAMDSVDRVYQRLEQESLHPDAATVDLILMDIMMPGINGLDACRSIKTWRYSGHHDHLDDRC